MNDFDYKQFRAEAALRILCSMISSPKIIICDDNGDEVPFNKINAIESAVETADMLIKRLK